MHISQIMNRRPIWIRAAATAAEAADTISREQVSDLMVVDEADRFVGVLSEGDLIRAIMPRFDELMQAGTPFSEAFEVFLESGRSMAAQPIEALVIRNALRLSPDDKVLTAASRMIARQIRRLPVVENDQLVGTVARADICRAAFRSD